MGNACFKWFLVRYLNPANHHLERITKAEKDKKIGFKDMKFPVKARDIHKIKKIKNLPPLVFLEIIENKQKYQTYVSKNYCEHKYVGLLLIGEKGKRHYIIIKECNTFM